MLYSIKETADTLKLGRTSVYNFIKSGQLKTVKLGSRTLVKASSIETLIENSEVGNSK